MKIAVVGTGYVGLVVRVLGFTYVSIGR